MSGQAATANGHARKLDGIQFGRGIAACLVVLFHAGRMLALPQYNGPDAPEQSLFTFGNCGVDFFFVLSGFVIFYVHQNDIGRPPRLFHYLWRRVTRIYPMYWVATALVIAIAALKSDWSDLGTLHLVRSVLLLPTYEYPILFLGWTLTHEVLFYAVFAIAILSRRAGMILGLIWLGLIVAGLFASSDIMLLRFVSDPYHLEFAFGILAALATNWFKSPAAWLAALAGIVLFAATAAQLDWHTLQINQPICRFLFGIASALILFGVSVSEQLGQVRFPRWAAYLGAASYSLYLLHTIFIGFAARAVFNIPLAHDYPTLAFLTVFGITIAAGCAAYQFVECPLQNLIRHSRIKLPGMAATAPPPA